MSKSENRIPTRVFSVSAEEIKELVFELNEAFDNRRKEISVKRNLNPFDDYPVLKEKFYLYVPGINEKHGSVYVENIEIPYNDIKMHIDSNVAIIKSVLESNHLIERLAAQQDDERALRGEPRLADITGRPKNVQWGDELVASTLAEAYTAITGLAPTMGGYKKPNAEARGVSSGSCKIRSPFTVFAMKLIGMGSIRRMGAGEYSVGILRAAMSANWRYAESGGSPLRRLALLKITESMPAKGPGRPSAGEERWRVTTTDSVDVEEYTPTEGEATTWDEYQVDDAPPLTCRLPGTVGVGL